MLMDLVFHLKLIITVVKSALTCLGKIIYAMT